MCWLSPVIVFLVFSLPYASRLEARGDGDLSLSIRVSKLSSGLVELAWKNRIETSLHTSVDVEGVWKIYHAFLVGGEHANIKNFSPSSDLIREVADVESWIKRGAERNHLVVALGIEDKPHGSYYIVIRIFPFSIDSKRISPWYRPMTPQTYELPSNPNGSCIVAR